MESSSMIISILGGLGLFLLGMAVMTDGLKALAGSALRSVLARAAQTPLRGTLWGAAVTLIVQSSSATTMTTIGLVSAGLLTFPQALGVVLGANLGTSGTAWLVALVGVKVSLNAAAMPMLFAGALLRLLGRGRWGGAGGALAGFALVLLGLTVLQGGMAGLAARVQPEDLPAVSGVGVWVGAWGVAQLVLTGIVMTTVMQSSSAAVAASISALAAGAIAPDQAAALVIGQNIGSSVSSALAAIGATTPAKRTALAHVFFNIVTASIVLSAFPLLAPLIVRWSASADATILLAAFHTGYNLLGVMVLLPLVRPFARLVERVLPQRGPTLTRFLDESVLGVPAVAVEAARRSVAFAFRTLCDAVAEELERSKAGAGARSGTPAAHGRHVSEAAEALERTRSFLSRLSEPPASAEERARLENVLHALDHAARLTESAAEQGWQRLASGDGGEDQAADACAAALRLAAQIASRVAPPDGMQAETDAPTGEVSDTEAMVADLAQQANELADLRRAHRARVLATAGHAESMPVGMAIAQAEAVRLLDRMAFHAWRCAARLAP